MSDTSTDMSGIRGTKALTPTVMIGPIEAMLARIEGEITALERVMEERRRAGDTASHEAQEAIKVGLDAAQKALVAANVVAKEAIDAAKAAHAAEHAALAMALALAMIELKSKLEEMNNFRAQIAAERTDYVTRDRLTAAITTLESAIAATVITFNARMTLIEQQSATARATMDTALTLKLSIVENKVTVLQQAKANLEGRFTAWGAVLGIGVVVTELFFKFVVRSS